MGRIDFSEKLEDEEVESLVAKWLDALSNRDLNGVLSQVAWLGEKGKTPLKALRNLSYDFENARQGRGKPLAIYRSASWVAASVSTGHGVEKKDFFLPIISTPGGAKILPEIDLLSGENRTRKFLNEISFDRLLEFSNKAKIVELKGLFEDFENKIKKN